MTPAKAEVFIARVGPDVEAATVATVAHVRQERPTAEQIAWWAYTVAELTGHMCDPNHTGIGAGHVSWFDPAAGRHRITGLHVQWETDEIEARWSPD